MRKSHRPSPTGPTNDSESKPDNSESCKDFIIFIDDSESCKKPGKNNSEPCKEPGKNKLNKNTWGVKKCEANQKQHC